MHCLLSSLHPPRALYEHPRRPKHSSGRRGEPRPSPSGRQQAVQFWTHYFQTSAWSSATFQRGGDKLGTPSHLSILTAVGTLLLGDPGTSVAHPGGPSVRGVPEASLWENIFEANWPVFSSECSKFGVEYLVEHGGT